PAECCGECREELPLREQRLGVARDIVGPKAGLRRRIQRRDDRGRHVAGVDARQMIRARTDLWYEAAFQVGEQAVREQPVALAVDDVGTNRDGIETIAP